MIRRRPVSMLLAILAVFLGTVLNVSPAAAAPPSFSGCTLLENGKPQRANDQYGAWVWSIIKYRCNTGKEYEFLGTLYQSPDSQGGTAIDSIYKYGVSTAPYVTGSYGKCDSTLKTNFMIYYSLEILGVEKPYWTDVYALNCRYKP